MYDCVYLTSGVQRWIEDVRCGVGYEGHVGCGFVNGGSGAWCMTIAGCVVVRWRTWCMGYCRAGMSGRVGMRLEIPEHTVCPKEIRGSL